MKRRRQYRPLSLFLLFLMASTTFASEPVAGNLEIPPPTFDDNIFFGPGRADLPVMPETPLLASVSMNQLPPGSLLYRFAGLHAFAARHLRSQVRQAERQALRRGWYVPPDDSEPGRALYTKIDHDWSDNWSNGAWWSRSWTDSLPPEKGGAPTVPYTHTFGAETTWSVGPLSVTNTFKIRVDYIALLEVDPDPVTHRHEPRGSTIALDLRSAQKAEVNGLSIKFRARPHLRLGLPQSGNIMSALRGLSLRGTFEISTNRCQIINGECELRWRPNDGLSVVVEIALAAW